jgi:hypothetical protein
MATQQQGHLFASFMDHVAADLYTTDTNKMDKEIDRANSAIKRNLTEYFINILRGGGGYKAI